MRFSYGISLAFLSALSSISYGFCLRPHHLLSHNYVKPWGNTHTKIPSVNPPSLYSKGSKSSPKTPENILSLRGGVSDGSNDGQIVSKGSTSTGKVYNIIASLWAAGGVVMILGKSIKRILPIALEPFGPNASAPLSNFQLSSYVAMCLWFAYVEGYKGFQLKFSPLVVARAQTLQPLNGTPIHHILFGPFYAMGLFHATKKRKIVSWSVSLGVGLIVAAVKRLAYPWRNIIDAGVIVGLSWGSLSIMIQWIKAALLGQKLAMDPALPEGKK